LSADEEVERLVVWWRDFDVLLVLTIVLAAAKMEAWGYSESG
jgi:predicted negative regulator of RcsB-dependent stress response